MLSPRYFDVKMNITYTLEELRAQHTLDSEEEKSFEDWINDMIENEILIPLN